MGLSAAVVAVDATDAIDAIYSKLRRFLYRICVRLVITLSSVSHHNIRHLNPAHQMHRTTLAFHGSQCLDRFGVVTEVVNISTGHMRRVFVLRYLQHHSYIGPNRLQQLLSLQRSHVLIRFDISIQYPIHATGVSRNVSPARRTSIRHSLENWSETAFTTMLRFDTVYVFHFFGVSSGFFCFRGTISSL